MPLQLNEWHLNESNVTAELGMMRWHERTASFVSCMPMQV